VAQAGTTRHDLDGELYEQVGSLAFFDSVGRITGEAVGGGGYLCSGTLIDSQWVLTAAHCVEMAASIDFTVGDQTIAADAWGHHPYWLPGNPLNLIVGYDAGLIHLSEPVVDIAPAPRFRGTNEVGREAAFVGFGQSGTGLTGALPDTEGVKRAGTNRIDSYFFGDRTTSRVFLADFDNPDNPAESLLGPAVPTALEIQTAPGDSGGAVFVAQGGQLELAGINSFLAGFDFDFVPADYGDISGATRVSIVNPWIDSVLQSFSASAASSAWEADLGAELPLASLTTWMRPASLRTGVPIPEPSSGALLAPLFLGLLGLRSVRHAFRRPFAAVLSR
jgi:hypothetical protein